MNMSRMSEMNDSGAEEVQRSGGGTSNGVGEETQQQPPVRSRGHEWRWAIEKAADPAALKDISMEGYWTLSTCKPGNGIQELLHEESEKFWQSDGQQPHTVTIEFQKKTDVAFIMLYLDYKCDESYTPNKISIHLGPSAMHLDHKVEKMFNEPHGWQFIDVRDKSNKSSPRPYRCWVVQLQVLQNHQNGRDTHIRHIRVLGPARPQFAATTRIAVGDPLAVENFTTKPTAEFSLSGKLARQMQLR